MKLVHVRMPEELVSELEKIGRTKGNCLSAEIRQRLHASLRGEERP
jgi:hypothetical protein